MAARKVKCGSCGTPFVPQRSTAKYCKPACREKARRDRSAAAAQPAKKAAKRPARAAKKAAAKRPAARSSKAATPPADAPTAAAGLVDTVRRDLEAANAVDTFNGQLALELARRVANPDEPSTSALSKELRAVMALAVGAAASAAGQPAAVETPPEDEVEKARRKREEARQAAGLS